jgi:hypothetical protein
MNHALRLVCRSELGAQTGFFPCVDLRLQEGEFMAKCRVCGAETSLYVNRQPICPQCDDEENRRERELERKPPLRIAQATPRLNY